MWPYGLANQKMLLSSLQIYLREKDKKWSGEWLVNGPLKDRKTPNDRKMQENSGNPRKMPENTKNFIQTQTIILSWEYVGIA